MPIAASDLLLFGAASRPEDDTSTGGGAVDLLSRPEFTDFAANAVAAVISDGAATRTVTVSGRLATGVRDTEVLTLNGATEVVGAKTWERILKVVASATSGTRIISLKQGSGGTVRATIPLNETTAYRMFIDSASATGIVIRYEKGFWRNNHATLSLLSAQVTLTADPAARVRIGLAGSVGDSVTITNRTTAPASITFSDDNVALGVPGTNLAAVTNIGMWVELNLPANDPAQKNTFTTKLAGSTV